MFRIIGHCVLLNKEETDDINPDSFNKLVAGKTFSSEEEMDRWIDAEGEKLDAIVDSYSCEEIDENGEPINYYDFSEDEWECF